MSAAAAAPTIDRHVAVDKGVEALLDHAILDAEPQFAFGVLVGRCARTAASVTSDRQFFVSHAFPLDRSRQTDGAADNATRVPPPTDPRFYRRVDDMLVGGLRIVGFYRVYTPPRKGAAATAAEAGAVNLERVSRAAFPHVPMVLLEKAEGSHEVKARIFNRERGGSSEPAELKYSAVVPHAFKRVACTVDLAGDLLLFRAYTAALAPPPPAAGAVPPATAAAVAALRAHLAAALDTAVGATAAGIPVEAYPSAAALPRDGDLRLFFPSSAAPLIRTGTDGDDASSGRDSCGGRELTAAAVAGRMGCLALVCGAEPAGAAVEALVEDAARSLKLRCEALLSHSTSGAFSLPQRCTVAHGNSSTLVPGAAGAGGGSGSGKKKNKAAHAELPLFSAFPRGAPVPDKETAVLQALGATAEPVRVPAEEAGDGVVVRVATPSRAQVVTDYLSRAEAAAAVHVPKAGESSGNGGGQAVASSLADDEDGDGDLGIELVADGLGAAHGGSEADGEDGESGDGGDEGGTRAAARTDFDEGAGGEVDVSATAGSEGAPVTAAVKGTESKLQSPAAVSGGARQRKKQTGSGNGHLGQGSGDSGGGGSAVADALQEELGYTKHARPSAGKASASQSMVMMSVVGIAVLAVVFALAMAFVSSQR